LSLPVVLRPEAQEDLLAAQDWYEKQRSGLGEAFTSAVEAVVERIEERPETYVVIRQGVHRAKLKRFPYVLYYRVLSDRVEVLAVLHGRRDPGTWQKRG